MRNVSIKRALILSLGLHAVLALLLSFEGLRPQAPVTETVTVDFIPAPVAPAAETVAEKKKKETPSIPKSKQIVEQDEKSRNDEKPLKDAYLSATDQRVENETMARERGEFRNRADKQSAQTVGQNGKSAAAKAVETPRPKPTLGDLMGSSPEAMLQKREEREQEAAAGNARVARQGGEASRTDDYLKVNQGAETMLNTREFKYYTYYSRIRRQLSQHWEPSVRGRLDKMFKQGRRIASDQDHITKLLIVLNEKGTLVKVQVLTESGVNDLDEAAIDAFRAAAPFPNPPKGIIEPDGTVKIRWDFVLES